MVVRMTSWWKGAFMERKLVDEFLNGKGHGGLALHGKKVFGWVSKWKGNWWMGRKLLDRCWHEQEGGG